ncbi:trypsin-like serine peptidase [Amycolatopsis pithecellobii]|uniref:Trypsin-like serine protease n=1 Tax=Amycolatopsis pithecellobii TaxID=664692 RepID=A0A6N7Z459_9PSEU|nr:serine protease [Amycolatopsis pithecellobii]MTD55161.1 trypsin-like serine protease [Amycolatopsis pithecellobii]
MRQVWWRSCAVVLMAVALVGAGTPAADRPMPVSTANVRNTTTTTGVVSSPSFAAVGALFRDGAHFCTASVVDSPIGDLVLTAAHCVQAGTDLSFAPGYHDGVAPYGMWTVTGVLVPDGWTATADPDLDFAFLTVRQAGNPEPVQDLTGGEELGVNRGFANDVTLVGYPGDAPSPVICRNTTTQAFAYQQRIACPGFPDGTSGGPWLTAVDPLTGSGVVVGVIGGYEQGGDTPDVSYSAYFDEDIHTLFDAAVR